MVAVEVGNAFRVSVIVPAYNAERYIAETLDSILSQTYKNIELIVVDDGSKDSTREITESFGSRVKYIYQENSGGCSSPRNNGYRQSSGDLLHFFDSDDIMLPHNIEEKVDFLNANPDAGLVCSNYSNFSVVDGNFSLQKSHFSSCPSICKLFGSLKNEKNILLSGDCASKIILLENFTISGGMMFRRSTFSSLGGYDEMLASSEDFDIHYRALLNNNCGVINSVGFYRRIHDANMSSSSEKMYINGILSAEKLILLETSKEKQRLLERRVAIRLLGLSRLYRGVSIHKSLGFCFKSLRFFGGFNGNIFFQFIRCLAAAFFGRK